MVGWVVGWFVGKVVGTVVEETVVVDAAVVEGCVGCIGPLQPAAKKHSKIRAITFRFMSAPPRFILFIIT